MIVAVGLTDLLNQTIIGLVNGAVYALVALGLVLVYRSSGIFNFAQAEFGTLAVYGTWFLFSYGVTVPLVGWHLDLPYIPAMLGGVAFGVLGALATERFVIRPLTDSPKVTLLVATTGVALLSIGVQAWRTNADPLKFLDALTQWQGQQLGEVTISGQRILTLVLLAAAVVAISAFLRSPYGLAVLAASQDGEAAELVGVNVKRVSMMVWGISGVLGALGGVLLQGGNSFVPAAVTSAALIPGFTAAVIGGLTSLPGAVVGGMIIGLLQAYGTLSTFDFIPGASSVTVFVVLLGVLLVKPEGLLGGSIGMTTVFPEPGADDTGPDVADEAFSTTDAEVDEAVPATEIPSLDGLAPVDLAKRGAVVAVLAWFVLCFPANILSPFDTSAFDANRLSAGVVFAVIGLSLNVLIGYTGQVSLGHQAFVGIGAFTSAYVVSNMSQEVVLGVIVAALVGGLQAFLLGLVSLRLTGLYFALVTLVYGVMAQQSIFNIESFTGGSAGNVAPRPTGFESDYRYYYFALIGLAIVVFVDWRLMQSKGGRALLALRENPRVAQTWGINTKAYTLIAFVVSGLFAGLGGGLLAHKDLTVVSNPFSFNLALTFVLMTTVGGLKNRTGVILGSVFFALLGNGYLVEKLKLEEGWTLPGDLFSIPGPLDVLDLTAEFAPLVFGPLLLLLVLTRLPGGFGQLIKPLTHWLRGGRFMWHAAEKEVMINDVRAEYADPSTAAPDAVNVLQTVDVSIRFGGVQALRDVNLRIDEWEIVGIIGPNGAGKTTLFNCITGFYAPTSGRVRYRGTDVTDMEVHERSKLGMGRTFQNVGLVKGSTAGENLKSAEHLEVRYGAFPGMFGAPKTYAVEKETEERAHAILELMGLDHLYHTRIQGLPYGLQKRLEIAAVLATDPDLLLLDEPGSGLGPEEADALGDFLLEIREKFELSITLIDHHVPLVTRVSDYMYCLNFGEVLAEGQPDDVRNHPEVVRAYLGDDPDAPPGKEYSPDVQKSEEDS